MSIMNETNDFFEQYPDGLIEINGRKYVKKTKVSHGERGNIFWCGATVGALWITLGMLLYPESIKTQIFSNWIGGFVFTVGLLIFLLVLYIFIIKNEKIKSYTITEQ